VASKIASIPTAGLSGVPLAAAMRPTIKAISQPSPMPIRPPNMLSSDDSARNCTRMSRRRAPRALRRPISRVRSVTDTSMIFMMPIPPTSSEMAAMPPRNTVNTLVMVCAVATKSCCEKMVKSSLPRVMRWRRRRISAACALALDTVSAEAACR